MRNSCDPKTAGDCPNFGESARQNGTVPFSQAVVGSTIPDQWTGIRRQEGSAQIVTFSQSNRVSQFILSASLVALLVALAVASRMGQVVCSWLPPNFHAVAGTALFAGFLFRGRPVALVVPLAAMWLSDQILGGYDRLVMAAVYGSLAAPVLFGYWLDRRVSTGRVVGASLTASTLFFLVTNAGRLAGPGTRTRSTASRAASPGRFPSSSIPCRAIWSLPAGCSVFITS